jgi:predicted lysophospholipase L1 biosynthesis ABC-type transport system permease subunit
MKKVLDFLKSSLSGFVIAFMLILLVTQMVMITAQTELIGIVFFSMVIIFSYLLGVMEGGARKSLDFLGEYMDDSSQS